MGKYLPVIKTAECGSLNRAAQTLGYTQPSLAYIINNMENELGVKLFHRGQRGVTLTDEGGRLLEIMRQIEVMEGKLYQEAQRVQGGVLRVGIFPGVAALWMPEVLKTFYQRRPEAGLKLEYQSYYLDGKREVKEGRLDCCFFTGQCPPGLESIPLYEDPYYLVVSGDSPLAGLESVTLGEVMGKERLIPTEECFDGESAVWELYQRFSQNDLDFEHQENRVALALVASGMGMTILPGLDLADLARDWNVKAIPLREGLSRQVSLLTLRPEERPALTEDFIEIVRQMVEKWRRENTEDMGEPVAKEKNP